MTDLGKALIPTHTFSLKYHRFLSVVSMVVPPFHAREVECLIKEDTGLSVHLKPHKGWAHSAQPSYTDPLQFDAQEAQSHPLLL